MTKIKKLFFTKLACCYCARLRFHGAFAQSRTLEGMLPTMHYFGRSKLFNSNWSPTIQIRRKND